MQDNLIIYKLDNVEYFTIDESTGELRLTRKFNTTNKASKSHLNVTACTKSHSHCATQSIIFEFILPLLDSNQNAPAFEQQTYEGTIREDALPGTVVATVRARDLDDTQRDNDNEKQKCCEYFIVSGDELNEFAISPEGKVYTRLLLDRERTRSYAFTLMAFDGKFKTLSSLVVNVLDVEDERPQCPQKSLIHLNVSETTRVETSLYNFSHQFKDNKIYKYELVLNDYESFGSMSLLLPFSIGEHDGHLRIHASLDYEHAGAYEFFVKITKANSNALKSLNCLCKFVITVIDENDNAPKFNETIYEASIIENAKANTIVTRVYARDSDSKLNGVVR